MNMDRDPVTKSVYGGIKRDIQFCKDNERHAAAALLTFAGIDAMAYLNMPKSQTSVTKKDFVKWANKYIKFKGAASVTGMELYGARCALLHSYSAASELARQGKIRIVGLIDKSDPPVIYRPEIDKNLVLLSVDALVQSFFEGIDQFLVDLFSADKECEVIRGRLNGLIQEIPFRDD